VDDDAADDLVAREHEVGLRVPRRALEAGLEPHDVLPVLPQQVGHERAVRRHLGDRVARRVVAATQQPPEVDHLDRREHDVQGHERPHPEHAVVEDLHQAADEVVQPQPQDALLHHRPDDDSGPGPAHRLQRHLPPGREIDHRFSSAEPSLLQARSADQ